jgi:phospholipase/lecithinase/hemolysin
MRQMKLALAAGLLLAASIVFSADTPADIDLRQAAKLHKSGDTTSAVSIWKKWAQQGDVDAAYNLALIHQYADGVRYDPVEAARWYRQAAEHGDKVSQIQLGLMYQNGEGMPADQAKAHEWFTKNRYDHMHHHHNSQFQQWQQQARVLIEERDRREAAVASQRDGERVLADLKRRASITAVAPGTSKLAAITN